MRINDKLFHPQEHISSMCQIPSLYMCLMCDAMSVIPYWLWSASLALHHSLCLDLVEDRLHVVSSKVLQKQNTPRSCAAEADAEAQNYVNYHQDCMQTQDCAGLWWYYSTEWHLQHRIQHDFYMLHDITLTFTTLKLYVTTSDINVKISFIAVHSHSDMKSGDHITVSRERA